ncbi:GNAT family N-acetyltransferase [Haloprofundus salinisoli]|uniref:GNAT family N-acetyltransferase n=1 Tax=Haloprofundus salinisoli TaxID=2876193 RepID=UPI001CCC6E22|nr:GNAT family N-acetyltransferase [Haloprofundus salinisoli]
MAEAARIAELWVALAAGQREFGSHLCADANREKIYDAITRHIVIGGLLVARDPEIVGFVMFEPEADGYEQDVSRGTIQNVYVEPAYRNEGVGSALLDAAESALADAGACVVRLDAMADNEAARRLYERRGYRLHRVELEKRVENDNNDPTDR